MSLPTRIRHALRHDRFVRIVVCLLVAALVITGAPQFEHHVHPVDDPHHDHAGLVASILTTDHDHDETPADATFHVHVACNCPCALPLPPPQWTAGPSIPDWTPWALPLAVHGGIGPPPYRPPIT